MTSNDHQIFGARGWMAVALLALVGTAGCDGGILDAEDPDVVSPDQLTGPGAVSVRTAGVINDFREAYDDYVRYAGLFTDEFVLSGTFPTRLQVDNRDILPDNATVTGELYEPLHVSRFTADDAVTVFNNAQGDPEFASVAGELANGIAVGQFYGGYSRILLSEMYCHSILGGEDGESAPLLPDARMQEAFNLLEQAEASASAAGRSDLATAAQIGQARAQVWLGNYQQAANIVSGVPTDFTFEVEYSANTTAEENEVFQFSWGVIAALRWTVGDGTPATRHNEIYAYFDEWVDQGLIFPATDPNNELEAFAGTGVPINAQTLYSDPATGAPGSGSVDGGQGADILLATGWEARMIEAEAELRAGNPGVAEGIVNPLLNDPSSNPMQVINPNVPTGDFDDVTFTGNLSDDLRELARARAAGLWLTGSRMGTVRRFAEEDGVDLFPQQTNGSQTRFPVVAQELNNNPNISNACP